MPRSKVPEGQTRDSLEYWGGIRPLMKRLGRLPELENNRTAITMELLSIGFVSLSNIMSWDEDGKVKLRSSKDIPLEALKAIKKVKVSTDRDGNSTLEVELYDKIAALRVLARASGLLDKPEDDSDKPSVIGINLKGPQPETHYQEVEDEIRTIEAD